MATEDKQAKGQSDEQSEKPKRRRASGGQTAAASQDQPSTNQDASKSQPAKPKSEAQAQPAERQELSELLQQQITQAIQPVLADFRRQMTDAVNQEIEIEQLPGTAPKASEDKGSEAKQQESQQPAAEQKAPQEQSEQPAAEQKAPQGQSEQPADGQDTSQEQSEQPAPEADNQQLVTKLVQQVRGGKAAGAPQAAAESVTGRVRTAASGALHLAEQQGEQWLVSLLTAGLEALLTETTHQAVQRRAEQGLHALLQKTLDVMPEGAMSEDQVRKTERTLQAILRETIDAIFAEGARTSLHTHGAEASRNLIHRDVGGALHEVGEAGKAVLQELVTALRRQWQRILRLLLRLILSALQDSLAPDEKDSLTDLSAEPGT